MPGKKPDFAAELNEQPDASPQVDAFKQTYGKPKLPAELRQMRKDRGWRFAADGLELKRELTREEFRDGLLNEVQAMGSAQQLIVGDAYLHGIECGFIETYEEMAELTGYEASSIKVYASLCRSIPRLMRINPLTYSHYQQIAPLDEDERAHWIAFAAGSELSYRAVKALIDWTKTHRQTPTLPEAMDGDNTTIAPEVLPLETVDENEEVTDIPPAPLPLDHEENWQALGSLRNVVKTKKYHDLNDDQVKELRRRIGIARACLSLLETQLPKPAPAKK